MMRIGASVLVRAVLLLPLVALALGACASQDKRGSVDAARINTQLGISYAQRGQYAAALDKLRRAIKQDPSSSAAHAGLAFVYQTTGEAALAENHYRKAMGFSPDDPALKNNFGVFLCSRDRAVEAEPYFLAAARDPAYATPEAAWTNAGRCLRGRNPEKAERFLREALKLRPDYREALGQLAVISYVQGDYLRTRAFLQRYGLDTGATAELLFIASRAEAALGDATAAREFERRLRLEFPESDEAASLTSNSS
jgi:type IV pilus assembly protein PilF